MDAIHTATTRAKHAVSFLLFHFFWNIMHCLRGECATLMPVEKPGDVVPRHLNLVSPGITILDEGYGLSTVVSVNHH